MERGHAHPGHSRHALDWQRTRELGSKHRDRARPAPRAPRDPPASQGGASPPRAARPEASNAVAACAATAANVSDTLVFERLVLAAFAVMARIATVLADKGCDAGRRREPCRSFGAEPHIRKRRWPHGSGLGKRRWPVERSNARVLESKRLALRYGRLGFIVHAQLQTACILLVAGRPARES